MSDQQIMINEPASNLATKFIDAEGVNNGASLLLRERTQIAGSGVNQKATVFAADPASNDYGLTVREVYSTVIAARLAGTLTVGFDPGHTLGSISSIGSSIAVFFDRGNPSVNINSQTSTLNVQLDPGHELGSLKGINNSIAVYLQNTAGTLNVSLPTGTLAVSLDPGHTLGSISSIGSSVNVQFDPGHTLGKVEPGVGTFQVFLPDTGHEIGSIRGNTNTLTVFLPDTGHTIGKMDAGAGTFNVAFSPAKPVVFADIYATAGIFSASGTVSSAGNNTIISPSASYNFKVFAYTISTTGIVSIAPRFTTGASAGATELYRPLINAVATTSVPVGANLSVTPPGYLFSTGTNATLSLYLDSGSLVHYSVSYIKESA